VAARVAARADGTGAFVAEVRPAAAPTAYYYSFDAAWPDRDAPERATATSLVFFVSTDHLGDQDRHGDLLDIFDVSRMLRHVGWGEPLPFAEQLDFDRDGRVTVADVRIAVTTLLASRLALYGADDHAVNVEPSPDAVTLRLADGSSLAVPRRWTTTITELAVAGPMAARLLHTTVPFAALAHAAGDAPPDAECRQLEGGVNTLFYRREPQAMRRYLALAFDNVGREPLAYAASVGYRMLRVFVIQGSDDTRTAQQFSGASRVYAAASIASLAVLALAAAGGWIAWRRGDAIALPMLLIAHIPLTLAFVLTNMRYSIAVQPFVFIFVAVTIVAAMDARNGGASPAASPANRAQRSPSLRG
jgi:hypothetical protein